MGHPPVFRVRSVATQEDLLPAPIQKSRGGPTQAAFGLSGGHPAPLAQPDRCVSHPVHPVLNLHCKQAPRDDKFRASYGSFRLRPVNSHISRLENAVRYGAPEFVVGPGVLYLYLARLCCVSWRVFPEPSVSVTIRSTPGGENSSFNPLGQATSIRSTLAAAPSPKCNRKSL